MSKAGFRPGRKPHELAEIIVTAWLKAVPDTSSAGTVNWPPDADELSAAFSSIVDPNDARCVAMPEPAPVNNVYTIFIPVPYPPFENKVDLIAYLHDNTKETNRNGRDDFGRALIFACGR